MVQFPGGSLGLVVVDGEDAEFSEVGSLRGLDWWSGEYFLDFCLNGCRDGIYLIWLRFASFAGPGDVVLSATFNTHFPIGRALGSSCFTIAAFVSWSCTVSTCGVTGSGAIPGT